VIVLVSDCARPPYYQQIECGRHALVADEPLRRGGLDAGPAPFALLLASLGACTAIAIRKYCETRSWPLDRLMVTLDCAGSSRPREIHRTIHVLGALSQAQAFRLEAVCDRTPMTRLLQEGIAIRTALSVQSPR
jgi:putative redox protein